MPIPESELSLFKYIVALYGRFRTFTVHEDVFIPHRSTDDLFGIASVSVLICNLIDLVH